MPHESRPSHPIRRILLDLRPLQNGYAGHGIGRYTRELTRALIEQVREQDLQDRLHLEALVLASPPWPAPNSPSASGMQQAPGLLPSDLTTGLTCPAWHRIWLWDQIVLGPLLALGRWHLFHSFAALGPLAQVSVPYLAAPKTLATVHDLHLFHRDAEPVLQAYRRTWRIRLQEWALPHARHLIVDASPIDAELRRHLGMGPAHPVHVIAPGINHRTHAHQPAFQPTRAPNPAHAPAHSKPTPPYLLAVGDSPNKGLDFAVLCALALRRSGIDITLTVVGKTETVRARIETTLQAAPAKQTHAAPSHDDLLAATTIIENPDDATLHALYQGATALLFPSTREGFGLPLLEAQAAGCPALALNREPMQSLVAEPSHRLPSDTTAWCAAITRLMREPAWRSEVSARGRAFAETFTWRRAAEHIIRLWLQTP